MKKIIFIFAVISCIFALTFVSYATESLPVIEESVPFLEETASTVDSSVAGTEAPTDAGERRMSIPDLLYKLWNDYSTVIFSGASAIASLLVIIFSVKKYIPEIKAIVKGILASAMEQSKAAEELKKTADERMKKITEKLNDFEDYDVLLKEMKEIYKENKRDREVFLKTLEMQAGQVNKLIDCSHLPQARKDSIFEEYKSQLDQINKLKEENNDG